MIYKLEPILTYNLWGGKKLSKLYNQPSTVYGEAWILCCINDRNSKIKNSKKNLLDEFNKNPEIVKKGYKGEFPLLIKLIDAKQDLSIQVHPSVKTESWHILSKKPSKLYMGFKKDTSKEEIEKVLTKGDITKKLNHVTVKEKDTFLINPGTIHAIGADTFLIEIQRSADVTYRLYDFHRKDKNGKERELHIDKALKVINYNKLDVSQSYKDNLLVSCKYFKVYRNDLTKKDNYVNIADDKSFHSIVVINGSGKLIQGKKEIDIKKGDSIFITASSGEYKIEGKLSIITTTL